MCMFPCTGSYFNSGVMDAGGLPSSGPPSSSGHVTFSSDNSYGFPIGSIFRLNSAQDSKSKGANPCSKYHF